VTERKKIVRRDMMTEVSTELFNYAKQNAKKTKTEKKQKWNK